MNVKTMKHYDAWKAGGVYLYLFFLLAALTFAVSAVDAGILQKTTKPLRVVMDDNYPPYIFKDSEGKLQGIIPDQWHLWEKKTGIPVQLVATDWSEAQRRMEAGEFDVIDTLFKNQKRELLYDFTKPYAKIDVPLYFRSTIAGIHNVNDLQGFLVAVKAGDSSIEVLRSHGVSNLLEFNSYKAIVSAARDGKVNVFTVDAPPANYFLYKFGIEHQFRKTEPMYSGEFHRAVRKGNHSVLKMVENGFSKISKAEYEEIDQRWFGSTVLAGSNLRYIAIGLIAIITVLAGMSLWLWILKRLVNQRTRALQKEVQTRITKEKILQENEAYLRTLIETIPDLIWLKDPNGVYLACNPKFERFFGAKQADIIGKTDYDFLDKELAAWFRQKDREAVIANKPSVNEEELTYADDGHKELVETIKTPMYDQNQNLIGVLGVARDITERESMTTRLQQASKLEAIGRLAGGVAHDLNNILSGIVSYPELLLKELPKDSEMRQSLKLIKDSGERATEIVADLLTVARGVASIKKITNINVLVRQYLSSPEYKQLIALHDEITCKVNLESELLNFSCSSVHIIKCLMNLVTNAIESVKGSGIIEISSYNRYIDHPSPENQYLAQGDYVVLKVTDTGSGIPEKDRKLIFEPFYTRKKMGKSGTGLGLYIVWNTVQDHQGGILIDSGDQGTSIELYFPATKEEQRTQSEEIELEPLMGNNETILIVDDEQIQRDVAGRFLKFLGYTVQTASSGEKAIEYLDRSAADLVILDMQMAPGINGRQTYEVIHKKFPQQKVIIVSGFSENNDVKAVIALGANGFVQKPYSMSTIGRAVKETL